jgi:enediyne biosynthesis protein E4
LKKREAKRSAGDVEIDPDTLERDDAIIGVALRWSVVVFVVLAMSIGTAIYALRPPTSGTPVQKTQLAEVAVRAAPPGAAPYVPFVDVTRQAGIQFRHSNAANGRKLLPETMGGGCAFFDFDADGDQDLLLVNSLDHWPGDQGASSQASHDEESSPQSEGPPISALYRNDGKGNFEEVTAGSGLDVSLYGMGAAVGDYDNDGRVAVSQRG